MCDIYSFTVSKYQKQMKSKKEKTKILDDELSKKKLWVQ